MKYSPVFYLSAKSIHLITKITALLEHIPPPFTEDEYTLRLRKINHIRTIRSSLAIEGNQLSEEQITALLNGIPVVAPLKEIQEVNNAFAAYDLSVNLNPFSLEDLLTAHRIMMQNLVENPGKFRTIGVGVLAGKKVIHVAPPQNRVPILMDNLFNWLTTAEDHLLIKSCLFHYEFEFIHPFTDGNGRLGRLWQSLLLSRLHPIFRYLPIENIVFKQQQEYYQAIQLSTQQVNSGIFVEFMLAAIYHSLANDPASDPTNDPEKKILDCIKIFPGIKVHAIAEKIGKSEKTVKRAIKRLKEIGKIKYLGAAKNGGYFIT